MKTEKSATGAFAQKTSAEKFAAKSSNPVCPVCGGAFAPLYTVDRFTPPLEIIVCESCALQRQKYIPLDPSSLYDEGYYTGQAEYSYRDERKKKHYDRFVLNARLRNIARRIPAPADLLDIGCAFGGLLEAARDFGYRVKGMDVSAYAASECAKIGLDVKTGMPARGVFEKRSFDIVTMIEVFEHITNPEETISALSEILRPGGLLVIQTANFLGQQAKKEKSKYHYYLPGHFFYYSTKNLRMLLNRHGFSEVKFYRPVDFGLLPKLLKSRGDFKSPVDYLKWFRIAWYHLKSRIAWGDFALTSSMTAYAIRNTSS